MKEIYTHMDGSRVGHFKSLLDEAGIACFVRNENSANSIAGVPIPVFYPTLCVLDDGDAPRALEILKAYQTPAGARVGEWICPACKALVPEEFDTCWNCQRERDSTP